MVREEVVCDFLPKTAATKHLSEIQPTAAGKRIKTNETNDSGHFDMSKTIKYVSFGWMCSCNFLRKQYTPSFSHSSKNWVQYKYVSVEGCAVLNLYVNMYIRLLYKKIHRMHMEWLLDYFFFKPLARRGIPRAMYRRTDLVYQVTLIGHAPVYGNTFVIRFFYFDPDSSSMIVPSNFVQWA